MPTYDYICTQCHHEFETFQLMAAVPLKDCPSCGEPTLKRKIGLGAGFIFKGTGFYETDFKDKKGSKSENSVDTKVKSESTSKPETKAAGGD